MCDDEWERELAWRRKLLALEDSRRDEFGEDEELIKELPETVLPPSTLPGERKRVRPMFAR